MRPTAMKISHGTIISRAAVTPQAQRPRPETRPFLPRRRAAVRCSVWLGRACDFIQLAQKQIRVAEVREYTHCALRSQACRTTISGDSDKGHANAATCTSIPDTVANVNIVGKSAVSLGSPAH